MDVELIETIAGTRKNYQTGREEVELDYWMEPVVPFNHMWSRYCGDLVEKEFKYDNYDGDEVFGIQTQLMNIWDMRVAGYACPRKYLVCIYGNKFGDEIELNFFNWKWERSRCYWLFRKITSNKSWILKKIYYFKSNELNLNKKWEKKEEEKKEE